MTLFYRFEMFGTSPTGRPVTLTQRHNRASAEQDAMNYLHGAWWNLSRTAIYVRMHRR